MYRFPAILTRDTNTSYLVRFPDVPEAITFGENRHDALRDASEALEASLSIYMEKRLDIPKPSRPRGKNQTLIGIPALSDAKVALYTAMRQAGIRKADLARRLVCQKSQVDRLLDLNHASRFDQLEQAFAALNKRLSIEIENAA